MYKERNGTPPGSKEYNDSRNEFILSFTPVVNSIAYRHFRNNRLNAEMGDLVNYGFIGLIQAMESKDIEEIHDIGSYFGKAISNGIKDGLRKIKNFSKRRKPNAEEDAHISCEAPPIEDLEKNEEAETVTLLLSALDPVEFRIIKLLYFSAVPMSQVSKDLAIGQSLGYKRKGKILEKIRGMPETSRL